MIKNYILLSLISLIWGSQFALNKILLTTFSPLWVAFLRVLLGLFTLIIILLFSKKKKSGVSQRRLSFVFGNRTLRIGYSAQFNALGAAKNFEQYCGYFNQYSTHLGDDNFFFSVFKKNK